MSTTRLFYPFSTVFHYNRLMLDYFQNLVPHWLTSTVPWLLGYMVVFSLLALAVPCNRGQRFLRTGIVTDLLYSLLSPTFYRLGRTLFMAIIFYYLFLGESQEQLAHYMRYGFGPAKELPLWLQAAAVFIISDFLLYFLHRYFHHSPRLWPFHAIHHSPEEVDWLSTFRFHPVNTWLSFALTDALVMAIGFSPASVGVLALFNMLYSPLVHANLNWTFGGFKYLFASPVFHRWHHTSQAEGMDKNFAPTFPIIDVMFGTFYMPEGKVPEHFGVSGANIPTGFFRQLVWPFTQLGKRR